MYAHTVIRLRDEALARLSEEEKERLEPELTLLAKLTPKEGSVVGTAMQQALQRVREAV
jgi:hypothetical protein